MKPGGVQTPFHGFDLWMGDISLRVFNRRSLSDLSGGEMVGSSPQGLVEA